MYRLWFLLLAMTTALSAQPLQPRPLEQVFESIDFDDPLFLTHAGDGSGRVFIVEKPGRIRVLEPSGDVRLFLDHRREVNSSASEGGLLGLAFDPDVETNGRVFLSYTAGSLVSRVSRMQLAADGGSLDAATERILLEVEQPAGNHNGGMIEFGPDGMLYIGLGDGGSANDRFGHGQDPTTLLATILRIDVSDESVPYTIPSDNPFVGNTDGWREEIWAWGLRNPWRFSFDRLTGELWAGDVGQDRQEEIDLIVKGGNYGWSVQEGLTCFRVSGCDKEGLIQPVLQYNRDGGRSVTGGYVYRGQRLSQLYGAYVYADYVSRKIWAIRYDGTAVTDSVLIATSPELVASFGEDEAGEVYVVGYTGSIYRIGALEGEEPRMTAIEEGLQMPTQIALDQSYPNPFNPSTQIGFHLHHQTTVDLAVFDILGQRVRTLVSATLPAGVHGVQWSGMDDAGQHVAPGVYFYRLVAGNRALTRRMLLLK